MDGKVLLWISRDSDQARCDVGNLAGLSFDIKEILRQNANRKIRIALDIISPVLMINQAETTYRFLTQLFQEAKKYDAVLLATLEETMHKSEVLASMEQVFDGVVAFKIPADGSNRRPTLQVRKMRGTPYALEMQWGREGTPPSAA